MNGWMNGWIYLSASDSRNPKIKKGSLFPSHKTGGKREDGGRKEGRKKSSFLMGKHPLEEHKIHKRLQVYFWQK
jgi:hypothetical protein